MPVWPENCLYTGVIARANIECQLKHRSGWRYAGAIVRSACAAIQRLNACSFTGFLRSWRHERHHPKARASRHLLRWMRVRHPRSRSPWSSVVKFHVADGDFTTALTDAGSAIAQFRRSLQFARLSGSHCASRCFDGGCWPGDEP